MGRYLMNLGMGMGDLARLRSNPYVLPALNPGMNPIAMKLASPKKPKKKNKKAEPEKDKVHCPEEEILSEEESGAAEAETAEDENVEVQTPAAALPVPLGGTVTEKNPSMSLQEAVVWAEILGEPVSRKRRKKRMGQLYGNQGYAGRR